MTSQAAAMTGQRTEVGPDRLDGLFVAHHRRLYQLARRLSTTPEDARDLVQETFLRAARAPQAIPGGPEREIAWLVRVLVNLCRDQWRRRATRRRFDARGGRVADASIDPEPALVARSVVWRALSALPPRRRAVIVMHELDGVAVATIAHRLGVSAVTVRWHLSRGRRQLADAIRGQELSS